MSATGVLLISCPDQPGVVAAVAGFVADNGGNIVHAEQHTDDVERVFFQRVEFELAGMSLERTRILSAFAPIAEKFTMQVQLRFTDERPRVGILASKQSHCLFDLLGRWRSQELPADIVCVIDNHPDHADLVEHMGVPYLHLPVTTETKLEQEQRVVAELQSRNVDLVVLARYMQILSPYVVSAFPSRIINIHHSFLPSFAGAKPYHQAHRRGVKLIGATCHFVTPELDEGPIVEQDVIRIDHSDTPEDMAHLGKDIEKVVLARGLRAVVEDRVLLAGNKTVIFR